MVHWGNFSCGTKAFLMSFHKIVRPITDKGSKSAYLLGERLPERFAAAGIRHEYKWYQNRDYPQVFESMNRRLLFWKFCSIAVSIHDDV